MSMDDMHAYDYIAKKPSRIARAIDGCHRFGWILTIIFSGIFQVMIVSYYAGTLTERINVMSRDIDRLKSEVFELSHITRGLGTEQ